MRQSKKYIILFILIIICVVIFSFLAIYYGPKYIKGLNKEEKKITEENKNTNSLDIYEVSNKKSDNSTIIKTNSKSTIRMIEKYDANMFKGHNSILIMWGTWCPHCQATLQDMKEVVDHYKNTDIKVYLISHDFELQTLVTFLEEDKTFNFEEEIFFDLERVIRKAVDPEANTVPVAYILDEDLNVVAKFDGGITLQEAKNMLKK